MFAWNFQLCVFLPYLIGNFRDSDGNNRLDFSTHHVISSCHLNPLTIRNGLLGELLYYFIFILTFSCNLDHLVIEI